MHLVCGSVGAQTNCVFPIPRLDYSYRVVFAGASGDLLHSSDCLQETVYE